MQVCISFATGVPLCSIGLPDLPGDDPARGFMVMGYVFCLFTVSAPTRFMHDSELRKSGAPMLGLAIWRGFALAMSPTGWGLWREVARPTYKAFLGAGWLFLISCAFTLAKTLRDAHEANPTEARRDALSARGGREAE